MVVVMPSEGKETGSLALKPTDAGQNGDMRGYRFGIDLAIQHHARTVSKHPRVAKVLQSASAVFSMLLEIDLYHNIMARLFDSSINTEYIRNKIVKCINMATEEEVAISSLRTLFGNKINGYMIVVFTGGDELEAIEQTLKDLLEDFPVPLKRYPRPHWAKTNHRK
ncbi:hypothetical protein OSB04_002991 [Centaurea solstitialis]|uniref:AIG1-type G domain-containing protein n=1 Tax=Centaurea solstitialis TaxID=347529 RepID=A0AA38U5Q5_9ASTR|nr:hypothetical protein OSB04_002991 [Centaurea solstitialis]